MGRLKYITFILLVFIGSTALAQVTPPPPPLPVPLPGVPIDGNILILITVGLALGSFYAYKKIKKSNS
jgi:hypothetical protein